MTTKRLLKLKRFDTHGQLLAAASPFIVAITGNQDLFDGMYAFYPLVGAWQMISMLATIAYDDSEKRWKSSMRRFYHILLLILIFAGICCAINNNIILLYLYTLLFVTPFMALLYVIISFKEMAALKKAQDTGFPGYHELP